VKFTTRNAKKKKVGGRIERQKPLKLGTPGQKRRGEEMPVRGTKCLFLVPYEKEGGGGGGARGGKKGGGMQKRTGPSKCRFRNPELGDKAETKNRERR